MKRTWSLATLAAAAIALSLAGCGGSGNSGGPSGTPGYSVKITSTNPEPMNNNGGAINKKRPGFKTADVAVFNIQVSAQNGFTGTVNLSFTNPSSSMFTAQLSSSSVALTSTSPTATAQLDVELTAATATTGAENFVITGASGALSEKATATVNLESAPSGFSFQVTPLTSSIVGTSGADSTALYVLTVTTTNTSFTDTNPGLATEIVQLAAGLTPTVMSSIPLSQNPYRVDVPLTITAGPAAANKTANFGVGITGNNGFSLGVQTPVTVAIGSPEYTISAANPVQTFTSATGPLTLTYNLTIQSVNGFTGTVNLADGNNFLPTGLAVSFVSGSVTVPANGSISDTCMVTLTGNTAPAGTYYVFPSGTSGTVKNGAALTAIIP